MMRFLIIAALLATASCAHKADLRTPSQTVKDEQKAREKAASAERRKARLAERDAERARAIGKKPLSEPLSQPVGNEPVPTAPVDPNEVSVPMGNK